MLEYLSEKFEAWINWVAWITLILCIIYGGVFMHQQGGGLFAVLVGLVIGGYLGMCFLVLSLGLVGQILSIKNSLFRLEAQMKKFEVLLPQPAVQEMAEKSGADESDGENHPGIFDIVEQQKERVFDCQAGTNNPE